MASTTALSVSPWRSPGKDLVLCNDEVHVWRAALGHAPSQINSLLDTLSEDEKSRAERFYFQIDRERFIIARAALREVLGVYLKRAAKSLSFCYGSHGKPALARDSGSNPIHFNLSHSNGVAVYAVARDREVGIDLEFIRQDVEVEQ